VCFEISEEYLVNLHHMKEKYAKGDIKYHVLKYLEENKENFVSKTVIDVPAGNGFTSEYLHQIGAKTLPFDIFPQYFKVDDLSCAYADILKGIPVEKNTADFLICQEGIEHFSDQFKVLTEFNRVLKPGGKLISTTPNYSGLRSRMSYFLSESEHFKKIMPPNEFDSVWMNSPDTENDIYFGHLFLIGASRLRTLAKLAGFKLVKSHDCEQNGTSILLYFLFFKFIYLANLRLWKRNKRKAKNNPEQLKTYRELFELNTSYQILTQGHLFFEFEKEMEYDEVMKSLKSVHEGFGRT
jgi:SAM-dependent methyltransferase